MVACEPETAAPGAPMTICDEVRAHCAHVAATARSVAIDMAKLEAFEASPQATLDASLHHLDGSPEQVARYMLTLDAINFGSGWFPTLRKRPGHSGYATVAAALRERFILEGAWSNAQLRSLDTRTVAAALGQDPDHELMALYAQALRALGGWLGPRSVLEAIEAATGSAAALAAQLADGMALFADRGFYKRAQIVPADLALAGVASFEDLDQLTIFADNLVPHVLRTDGVLVYEPRLAAHIDAGRMLRPGPQEREIRACAVHACELLSARLQVPPRVLDNWLWNRGQEPAYKARPRHRCRCVYY
ncbi:MAG TPA: queuosine salvage family protein [Solirubrobacteraceae bacterium]|nr:queuosine salvage family protein [Solirubrobacteraceae bacterium]